MRGTAVIVLGAAAVFTLSQLPPAQLRADSTAMGREIAALGARGWQWLNDSAARHANVAGATRMIRSDVRRVESWVASAVGSVSEPVYPIAGARIQIVGASGARQMILHMARTVSVPLIERTLGMKFRDVVSIRLFATRRGYDAALIAMGVSSAKAGAMVNRTGGVEAGSSVFLPLFNDPGRYTLTNVLTHELTHVLLYQNHLSHILPIWMNEGTACYEGLAAEREESPTAAASLLEVGLHGVAAAQASATEVPLQASEAGLLRAPYDAEIQDFEAVALLVRRDGLAHYAAFLRRTSGLGVAGAFRDAYGMTLPAFCAAFMRDLKGVTLAMEGAVI